MSMKMSMTAEAGLGAGCRSPVGWGDGHGDGSRAAMTARMMPGGPVAEAVFADLQGRIEKLIDVGHTPGLGTLLVGDDSASAGYIRMKQDKAAELGLASPHVHLPQDATQDQVVAAVR